MTNRQNSINSALPVKPLPHMPILGYSNSAANKDKMSKLWTKLMGIQLSDWVENIVGKKEKLLVMSNFSFSHHVFKSCLILMHQNDCFQKLSSVDA